MVASPQGITLALQQLGFEVTGAKKMTVKRSPHDGLSVTLSLFLCLVNLAHYEESHSIFINISNIMINVEVCSVHTAIEQCCNCQLSATSEITFTAPREFSDAGITSLADNRQRKAYSQQS
jgi:hypothetical protein